MPKAKPKSPATKPAVTKNAAAKKAPTAASASASLLAPDEVAELLGQPFVASKAAEKEVWRPLESLAGASIRAALPGQPEICGRIERRDGVWGLVAAARAAS